jgi:steroid delta-isomerase-like uncharacterized protein
MSTAENIALAHRWFEEVWNQRRFEAIDELLSPDSRCETAGGFVIGRDEFREQMLRPLLAAFPDVSVRVDGTVAEGDEVVVRWTARGTYTGEGLGFPANGQSFVAPGLTWIRYRDGIMQEGRNCWDFGGLVAGLREGASTALAAR